MIIWIASYPKSGNTWIRSIVSSLIYTEDGKFEFDLLKKVPQFPIKKNFDGLTDKFRDIHELKKNWIHAQDKINLDQKIKFLKTHHLNCKIDGYNFTNLSNTCATIYVVRDPRNLINSISNHYDKSKEDSKKFLVTPQFLGENENNSGHVVTLLGNWGEHYKFWKQNSKNFLLIKYESLIQNVDLELDKIINFLKKYLKFNIDKEKRENIIKTTSFKSLKNMEEKGLFKESVLNKNSNSKVVFFHQGPDNKWENSLDEKLQIEIEQKFKTEMEELGYLGLSKT